MRKNIFLLIVIIQQAVCLHQSIFEHFRLRIPHNYNDDFEKPMEYPSSVNDGPVLHPNYKPPKAALDTVARPWRVLRPNAQSNDVQYREIPSNMVPSNRRKRPDASNLEKLTYLLNNYNPRPKINREVANKKRTHLFGFWTNYLARN